MKAEIVGSLPCWQTSFIGRVDELAGLRRLVRRSRLVTVTGPGGVGKTRLAVHMADELRARFPGGVFFVNLAAISGPDLEPAVAGSLAAGQGGRRSPLEVIGDRFGDARALLVLDNCEHLIEPCARLARALLDRCAGLTVLATSREPLAVNGEVGVYRWCSNSAP